MRSMLFIFLLLAVLAWGIVGSLKRDIADLFWPDAAAPWETVDAFYYPDRSNLIAYRSFRGLASVDACRSWVSAMATANNDLGLVRSDYGCGVGKMDDLGDVAVYRLTVR